MSSSEDTCGLSSVHPGESREGSVGFNRQRGSPRNGLEPLDDSVDSFLEGTMSSVIPFNCPLGWVQDSAPHHFNLLCSCHVQQKKSFSHRRVTQETADGEMLSPSLPSPSQPACPPQFYQANPGETRLPEEMNHCKCCRVTNGVRAVTQKLQ